MLAIGALTKSSLFRAVELDTYTLVGAGILIAFPFDASDLLRRTTLIISDFLPHRRTVLNIIL